MRRVVITGMGAVTPVGNSVEEMWKSVKSGKCGIDKMSSFRLDDCNIHVAAEVKDFDSLQYFTALEAKKLDKFSLIAVAASLEAYEDALLDHAEIDRERFSIVFGSGIGGGTMGPEYHNVMTIGFDSVSKMTIPINLVNMAAANIAIRLKAYGSCTPIITACATGSDCIGRAFRDIKHGYSDVCLAGGADACINPVVVAGFASIGAMTKSKDPNRACIPFDKERNGFVIGEGAGSVILEEYEHAKARNAKIYAEVVAYGTSCDAFSLTAPDMTLAQGSRAIYSAMAEAGIGEEDIDYINAHGTSTVYNDRYETSIIKKVFGEKNPNIAVSSTKSMTGHLLGAAGSVEAIVVAKAMQDSFLPPTIGYRYVDQDCDIDCVPNVGRKKEMTYGLSNSLGFGGHNTVLILKNGGMQS